MSRFDSIGPVKGLSSEAELEISQRQKQILAILSQHGKMPLREVRRFLENPHPQTGHLGMILRGLRDWG